MTELEEYFTSILDGKIVACHKMKQVSEMILERYASPDRYHFDLEIASRHIRFIESVCKQPTGKMGQPIKLELFQKARLQVIFGFVDDDNLRQYQEVLTIEGRKNGKTTENSCIELDLLINDGEGAPQRSKTSRLRSNLQRLRLTKKKTPTKDIPPFFKREAPTKGPSGGRAI